MSAVRRALSVLVALAVGPQTVGCGDAASTQAAGLSLGEACSTADPCETALLCVDGVCLARPFPPDTTLDTRPAAPIDIVVGGGDTQPLDTGPPDGSIGDTEDTGETVVMDSRPPPTSAIVTLGEHDALNNPGGDALTLNREQAAVAQFVVPVTGQIIGLEVIASEAPGVVTCGRYRPAVWISTDAGFVAAPDFEGETQELGGSELPQTIADFPGPRVTPSVVRAGLVFEDVCLGAVRQPVFVLDDSGDGASTWVWAGPGGGGSQASGGTFIDASTLQLNGRWGFRLRVAIDL